MKIVYCKTAFAGPISGADEIAVMYAVSLKRAGHSTAMLLVHLPACERLPRSETARGRRAANDTRFACVHGFACRGTQTFAIRAMRAFSPTSEIHSFEVAQGSLRYHEALSPALLVSTCGANDRTWSMC
jgi:hypothetical protein